MAAPLYTDVANRMRVFLNDLSVPGGATYDDAFCQQFIEPAQATMVNYLIANSVERLKFRTETPLTITAGITILDRPVAVGGTGGTGIALVLPNDFIEPDELFEAKVGGSNEDFVAMNGPGAIPRIAQRDILGYWNWYDGRIHLLGSTVNRLVRLIYWSDLGSIDPSAHIKIVASGNALAALAASIAARSRGQYDIADRLATFNSDGTIGGQAGWELLQIINADIKTGQSEPSRRRPYFGRDRYSTQTPWVRGRF